MLSAPVAKKNVDAGTATTIGETGNFDQHASKRRGGELYRRPAKAGGRGAQNAGRTRVTNHLRPKAKTGRLRKYSHAEIHE